MMEDESGKEVQNVLFSCRALRLPIRQRCGGPGAAPMKPTHPLRALRHRNFRLFFAGQSISLIGTWMQQVATSWLVYLLTQSAWWLGLVTFAGQVPSFFLAPVAGVVVDRANRHRLLILTQALAMLQAFALAGLALRDTATVGAVLVLNFFVGLVNAFDMTARQAFLTELVGGSREDLANAIALNSAMVNGARLVGPALAGIVLTSTSPGVCFLINGLSYLAVLLALLAMRVQPRPIAAHPPFLHGLREGFAYALGFAPIRAILLLLGVVSMAGMAYTVLLPILATATFHGGAGTLALLTTASGVGALAAGLFLAARHSVLGLGRWIAWTPTLFGAALIALSSTDDLPVALPLLAVAGFAMMAQMAASNTVLQTIVTEDKRGRVMSLYLMAFMGMAPLGSLTAGWLAEEVGVTSTLRLEGAVCVAGSLLFAAWLPRLRALVRPLYVQMGILPELASALPDPQATDLNEEK
jgi:MFS family permease